MKHPKILLLSMITLAITLSAYFGLQKMSKSEGNYSYLLSQNIEALTDIDDIITDDDIGPLVEEKREITWEEITHYEPYITTTATIYRVECEGKGMIRCVPKEVMVDFTYTIKQ